MLAISTRQQSILSILLRNEELPSSAIHSELTSEGDDASLVTTKRMLTAMTKSGVIVLSGSGPSTVYSITPLGRLYTDVDAATYGAIDPDVRYGLNQYNFNVLSAISEDVFSEKELRVLTAATTEYHHRIADVSPTIQKKELERLVIELSWKSSKIEGNTYTLLDTERLILDGIEAPGHSKAETQMILNHKDAFTFIHEHTESFQMATRANLEKLHSILVKDLSVGLGFQKKPVGVLDSRYQPLDNIHQIRDAIDELLTTIDRLQTPYAKALIALIGVSYIQPFEDGNKRTSRLMANALLMAHKCAPLSYRSINEEEYREAILVFYELNSLVPIKRLFISQYDFAARNYVVK